MSKTYATGFSASDGIEAMHAHQENVRRDARDAETFKDALLKEKSDELTILKLRDEVSKLRAANNKLRARLSALRVDQNGPKKAATRVKRAASLARTHKSLSSR